MSDKILSTINAILLDGYGSCGIPRGRFQSTVYDAKSQNAQSAASLTKPSVDVSFTSDTPLFPNNCATTKAMDVERFEILLVAHVTIGDVERSQRRAAVRSALRSHTKIIKRALTSKSLGTASCCDAPLGVLGGSAKHINTIPGRLETRDDGTSGGIANARMVFEIITCSDHECSC